MVVALLYASRHLKKAKAQTSFTCNTTLNWRPEPASNVRSPTPRSASFSSTSGKSEKKADDYDGFNYYVSTAFYTLIGLPVELQTTDGEVYEGILESVAASAEFHLVGAHLKYGSGEDTENTLVCDKVVAFKDIIYCRAKSVDIDFAKHDELLIDSDISRGVVRKDRDLVQWQPDDSDVGDVEESDLDDADQRNGWDFNEMIRVHEQKHGAYSTFEHTMSSYMSPYDGINNKIHSVLADKAVREIQLESQAAHKMPEDLISEEELKSDDDLKSDESSKSEYPKSSEDELKSEEDLKSEEELKSEDELKSDNGADDEEGHEDSGIGEEDVFSSISSTPPPTPTDSTSNHAYKKHNRFYKHQENSSSSTDTSDAVSNSIGGDGSTDDSHQNRIDSAINVDDVSVVSSDPKPKEVLFEVSGSTNTASSTNTDGIVAAGDDGFTVSRSRSRRRSRRKKKQQEEQQQLNQGEQKQTQQPQQQRPQRQQPQQQKQQQQQQQHQKQLKQQQQQQQQHQKQQQQQQQQQQQRQQLQQQQLKEEQQLQQQQDQQQRRQQQQQQQQEQLQQQQLQQQQQQQQQQHQQQPLSSVSCSYRNVLSYSAVTMRKSDERPPSSSSMISGTSCRRSSTSSTSSTSSSLQTQISAEDYPIPITLKKTKSRHKTKQKTKTAKATTPVSVPSCIESKNNEPNTIDNHATISTDNVSKCSTSLTLPDNLSENKHQCEDTVEDLPRCKESECTDINELNNNDTDRSHICDTSSVQDSGNEIPVECVEETVLMKNEDVLHECPPDSWEDMNLMCSDPHESEYKFLDNNCVTQASDIDATCSVTPITDGDPGELRFFDSMSSVDENNSEEQGISDLTDIELNFSDPSQVINPSQIEQDNSEALHDTTVEQSVLVVDPLEDSSPTSKDSTGNITLSQDVPGTDNCCYLVLTSATTDPSTSLTTTDSCSILDVHGSVNQPPTLNGSDILVRSKLNPAASEFTLNPAAKEFIFERKTFTDGNMQVQQQEYCYSQTYIPYVGLPDISNDLLANSSGSSTPTSTTTTNASSTAPVIRHHHIPYKQFYTWSYVPSGHGFYYGIPTPLELFSNNGSYYFAAAQPHVNEQMQQILQQNGLPVPTDTTNYTHARQFYVMHQSVQYTPSQQECWSLVNPLEGPATDGVVDNLLDEQARKTNPKDNGGAPQEEFKEGDPAVYQTAFPPLTESQ